MHTGCPVIEGIKWNAVKWIHGVPFREDDYLRNLKKPPKPAPDPGDCQDMHPLCEQWAASGECTKNADYMTGGGTGQGSCRRACKDCQPCALEDKQCRAANRAKGGYLNFDANELKLFELGTSLEM
ncbi:hypothetical protein DUNSADRAFT_2819 [Dunaliella salina]|nr:hypothetical protein DUNSADRAFT_2819 [Dunaliella salina]|eukprot:KAF5826531.1 hypothetical protein DUNSADRAFT_2819 [Dunaliella salina]